MVASLVEIKCYVFLSLDYYYFLHLSFQVQITFFLVEIVKCSLECLTDVSIMFSQRSTSLKKT